MGSGGAGNAVGKDISSQNVRLDLGGMSPNDARYSMAEILRVVFGDYTTEWDGVVRQFRKLEKTLTENFNATDKRLEQVEREIIEVRTEVRKVMTKLQEQHSGGSGGGRSVTQYMIIFIVAVSTLSVAWDALQGYLQWIP